MVIKNNLITLKPKIILLIAIIAGVLVRLVTIFVTKSHLNPELFEYEDVIRNLFLGRGFVYYNVKYGLDYYAAIHPLFTFLCAGIYLITNHSFLAVEIFQSLISVSIGYFVYLIAKDIFNEKVGLIAAILTIFHPGQIIFSTVKIQSPVLDTFFFVLVAFWILKIRKTLTNKDFMILGFFIGLGSLARGTLIILLPIAAIYYCFIFPLKRPLIYRKMSIAFLFTVLMLSPWWIRNYMVLKQPVYMTTESMGYIPWVGFNDNATGTLYALNGKTQWEAAPDNLKNAVWEQKTEIAQQNILKREAANFIINNPLKSLGLYFKRIFYFWWFTPTQGFFYPKIYFQIYKILYIGVLLFLGFGLIRIFRSHIINKSSVSLLWAIMFGLSLLQGLYYVEGRHRWQIEPFMLIFAAYGVSQLFKGGLKDEIGR